MSRSPALTLRSSSSIAAGWSPAGCVLADHLEPSAGAHDGVDRAVLRVRQHGMFSSESHIHQGRTPDRHVLFRGPGRMGRILDASTLPNTRHSTCRPVPTPIRRASCGPWTPTPSSRGACTWPAPPPDVPVPLHRVVAATGVAAAGHRVPFQPRVTNATRTSISTSAATHRVRRCGTAEDHYLDLVVRTGAGVELADADELLTAVRHRLLSPETGEQAVQTAVSTIEGLSRHDYDLDRWLAGHGHSPDLAGCGVTHGRS